MSYNCNKLEFCKNVTEYRVVYDTVYFYTNENGVITQDTEMVPVNRSYTGSIDFINNNMYIDIGMNNYIPIFDKKTGDVLVTTLPVKNLNITQHCPDRSSLPIENIKLPDNFAKNALEGKPVIPPPMEYLDGR